MISKALEDDQWGEPQRDKRGRFKRGTSGNPHGRPRNRPAPQKSLAQCFAERLAKEVAVNENGKTQILSSRELLAESIFRGALKAKPKDAMHILERTDHLAAGAEVEAYEGIYTEEDRRIMEKLRREFIQDMCCQCERPIPDELLRGSIKEGF